MRQKQMVALALASAVSMPASPLLADTQCGTAQSDGAGSVAGTSRDEKGSTVAHVKVSLRDLGTGKLTGTTTSDENGQFSFCGLKPGTYAIELVNDAGQLMGTSAAIAVTEGATVTGATVTVGAATQAALLAAAAGGGGGGLSTALIVTAVAAGAGIAALVIVKHNASPSK
jgi:uncharacterized protein (DUF2141 family)